MITIDYATIGLLESQPHLYTIEASTLGLRPGEWPERIETKLGNRMPLMRAAKKLTRSGDLGYVRYKQANGCVSVIIFND